MELEVLQEINSNLAILQGINSKLSIIQLMLLVMFFVPYIKGITQRFRRRTR